MSWWGGREHFITARVECLSDICMYFEGCTGASVGEGDEGSGVVESEEGVDDEGESSRERLGIACANVTVRRLLYLYLAPHAISSNATILSSKELQGVSKCIQRVREGLVLCSRTRADSDIEHGLKN